MKLSVIVPVYNVEKYLEKCVDSVLCQSFKDLELLLIDDGSTDGSGALCDKLAEKDSRIHVIHQENKGLGGARNTGIREAKGEWLIFPDSDDYIEPELFEKAITAGETADADMVVFGFRSVDEQGNTLGEYKETQPTNVALDPHVNKDVLLSYPAAWNKLYRRELFEKTGAQYPPRVWYEDIRTTPKLMTAARSIVFIDYIGYDYLQRAGSIMNNSKIQRNVEIIEAFDDLLPWFSENGLFEEYRDELEYLTLYHEYLTASVRVIRLDRKHRLLKSFREYINEKFPAYMKNKYISRLTGNQRLLLKLIEKKMYLSVDLIFKVKG